MIDSIYNLNNHLWIGVEEALVPLPEKSTDSKILHILPTTYLLPAALLTEMLVSIVAVATYAASFFSSKAPVDPHQDFSVVCKDPREWTKIGNLEGQLILEENDVIGPATCTFQDSGSVHCPNSQWVDREKVCLPEENRTGSSANLFQLYKTPAGRKEVIDRLHKLGANSYRFSVEWSQIEPQEAVFDQEQIRVYLDLCIALRDEGIRPMVTLHHFSEPKWFHEKGSFEKEENIEYFVRFSDCIYRNLTQEYNGKALVDLFCTINEPAVEAFSRYVRGAFSPAITFNFERGGKFLKGALKAHTAVYNALKAIPASSEVKIGITHQRLAFKATNHLLYPIARYLSRLTNDVTLNYFKTGNFELKIPFFCNVSEKGAGKPGVDWVGVQYYTEVHLEEEAIPLYSHRPMTQMPFRENPEGLFEAITEVYEACQKPIIVTENGISTHDEKQRARYMERALYATHRAKEVIGKENFLGYYLWSFCDNFEWDMGHDPQKFGAYALIKNAKGERVLSSNPKTGIEPFTKVAKAWQRAHNPRESQAVA